VHGKIFALMTVFCMAALTLLLRATLEFWPVGLGGAFSRSVAVVVLGGWVLTTGAGWRRFAPNGAGPWLLLSGVMTIVLNLLLYGSLKWTTATNHALLYRLDILFVVLIGIACWAWNTLVGRNSWCCR